MSIKSKITTCSILTGAAIGILHVANRYIYHLSSLNDYLYNQDGDYYDWRFGRIYYTKKGKGSPILLIHDLNTCSSSYEWNKITDELSLSNTIYTIDLLGCGNSEKPTLTYTNYLYVNLITDFIKNIIKEKTDIISTGHSSSISLMTCSVDDTLINKIILVNPDDIVDLSKTPGKREKLIKYALYMPIIGTFIYNMLINKKSVKEIFTMKYFYDSNKIDERDIAAYVEASQKEKTHGKYLFANILAKFTNINILNNLTLITNDIFIIVGKSNPNNTLIAEQYKTHLPSIEIDKIEETDYLPQLENPKEFIEKVKIFLELE